MKDTDPFEDSIGRDELSAPPTVDLQSVAEMRSQELQSKNRKTFFAQNLIGELQILAEILVTCSIPKPKTKAQLPF